MSGKKKNKNTVEGQRKIADNRRARYDYFIEDNIEVGIMLKGTEVKSIREGNVSINESYAEIQGSEIFLVNMYIAEYTKSNIKWQHEVRRPRKLLLNKREMNKLIGAVERKGTTLVPISLYFNKRGIAKIDLAIASGKKQHDKRQTEKKRDWSREKSRIMRGEKL